MLALVAAFAATDAVGQITWTGTGSTTNWSESANWLGTAPVNNATRTLVFAGASGLSNTNNLTGVTATTITFNSSGFVLGGANGITLGGNITNNVTSGTNEIALNMAMASTRTVTGSGGSTLVLSGNLSGAGGLTTARSAGSGPATITLSGSNSYTGNTTAAVNTLLNINSANAISSGTMILNASGLSLGNTSGTSVTLSANPAMRWGADFSYLGPNSLNLGTGNVTMIGNVQNLSVAEGSTLTVGGNVAGSVYTLGKVGNGTLWLTGSNSVTNLDAKAGALVLGSSNAAAQVSSLMRLQGGVFGITTGTFTRNVGGSGGAVSFTSLNSGGGFAAYGQGQAVNLTVAGVSGTLTWASTAGFLTSTQTFILGASDATGAIDFLNPINLGSSGTSTRTIQVVRGKGSIDATLSGGLLQTGGTQHLTKTGNGILLLPAVNTYSGTTSVNAGTLLVNGSILNSPTVTVASGAALGGSGAVSAITGAGLVSPGNSPGILTATAADLSSGLDFAFEFTQSGAPTWLTGTASGNDVLRLTNLTTPISGIATASNVFDIYFAADGQTYRGGLFTDKNSSFESSISGATFNYYVQNATGTVTFNGTKYNALAAGDVTRSTVQVVSANFSGGSVSNGYTMEFVVVPEPQTIVLFGIGSAVIGWSLLNRRRRNGRSAG